MRSPRTVLPLTLLVLLAASITLTGRARAAEEDVEEVSAAGIELDAVPIATGGFSVSAWHGSSGWRVRPGLARLYPPDFMVPDGFEGARVDALSLFLDWFPGWRSAGYRGFRVGAGLEYWRSVIARAGVGGYSTFTNTLVAAGGGYLQPVWRNLYLEPAVAGHLVVAGDRDIPVSGVEYHQRLFTPEVSLKLGLSF